MYMMCWKKKNIYTCKNSNNNLELRMDLFNDGKCHGVLKKASTLFIVKQKVWILKKLLFYLNSHDRNEIWGKKSKMIQSYGGEEG